jgi:hypothetical protein
MMALAEALDISDHRDRSESADPADSVDPIDSSDAKEPTLPIEAMEPTLPIDRMEPRLPIERMESFDHSDKIDPFLAAAGLKGAFLEWFMRHVRACAVRSAGWVGTG